MGQASSVARRAAKAAGFGPPLRRAEAALRASSLRVSKLLARAEPTVARHERVDNAHIYALFAHVLHPHSNCIDVGAHKGSMLSEMVRLAPRGRHVAYEPVPSLCDALAAQYPSVDVRCAALSDGAGMTSFRWVKNLPGMSGLEERAYPTEPEIELLHVRTERLDDVLPADYVPALIKVDVEGAEMRVFRGAENTLRSHHPMLIFEYGRGTQFTAYGTTPDEIWTFLHELDYRVYALDGRGPLTLNEFSTIEVWNFVAHP